MSFLLYRCQIENVYIHQRHCSLLIFYNLKSQTKQALLQLNAETKFTRGRTEKWAKRFGGETTQGERESGRNYLGANGKVVKTTRIQVNVKYKTCTGSDQTGYKMTKLKIKVSTK